MSPTLASLLLLPALVAQGPRQLPSGAWTGTVQVPGMDLYVEVHLEPGPPWSGTISIPLQGAKNLPLEGVAVTGDAIAFSIAGIPGAPTFQGSLTGTRIQGTFSQGGQQFPFHLERPRLQEGLPKGLRERELQVGGESTPLPALLTVPEGKGPWPLMILVHGSGPGDKDASLGPSRPFRDLAWGLARNGIAVLRYDKRTLVHKEKSARDMSRFTVQDEVVEDVSIIAQQARRFPEVDPARIFILGHSLGGMLVPRIARAVPEAAGFVIWAGAARPLEDLVLEQARRQGAAPDRLRELEAIVARIKALDPAHPPKESLLFAPAAYWLDLRGYRPAEEAKALSRPMLILQGDRDAQVTQEDFTLWQKALGGHKKVRFKRYPDLNHLFMPVNGPSTGAEYTQPGQHVATEVIQDIGAWILGIPQPTGIPQPGR